MYPFLSFLFCLFVCLFSYLSVHPFSVCLSDFDISIKINKNQFVYTILVFFSHCRPYSWLLILRAMSEFNKTNNSHFYFLTVNICKHNACKPFLETCFPWKNSNGYICCEWSSARGQYIKKVRDPIKGEQILNCGKTTFYLETKAIIALLFQLCEMNLCYCLKNCSKTSSLFHIVNVEIMVWVVIW